MGTWSQGGWAQAKLKAAGLALSWLRDGLRLS